jgi:protocatechuate 3,4-dioxygenase beta subunit
MPGHYKGEDPSPPAHIHFDIRHPNARGLMTELDFQSDPALDPSETAVAVVPVARIAGSDPPTLRPLRHRAVALADRGHAASWAWRR